MYARVSARACVLCACAYANAMCLCACTYAYVYLRACVRVSVCVFLSYLQYVHPGIQEAARPLSHNVGCMLMFDWVWNVLVIYHDEPDLHQGLKECMYVRMLECMPTPLNVHVTHTQHTHTRIHTCLGLYVCIF